MDETTFMIFRVASLLFAIVFFAGLSAAAAKTARGRPILGGIIGAVLFFVLLLIPFSTDFLVSLVSIFILFLILDPIIVLALADKRPKCPYCKTVKRKGARVCHACGNSLVASPQKKRIKQIIPCPCCGKALDARTIKEGLNKCPFCSEEFECA